MALYEGGEVVALIHIYTRQDRGRVSMWISDRRSVHGSFRFRATGISRGIAPHSLARQPRVGGAALCII